MSSKKALLFILSLSCIYLLTAQEGRVIATTMKPKKKVLLGLSDSIIAYLKYNFVDEFDESGVTLATKGNNNSVYLIDKNGKVLLTNFPYPPLINERSYKPYGFSDGMMRVVNNDFIGAVNYKMDLVVQKPYKRLANFGSNHAIGERKGAFYVVNKKGEEQLISQKTMDAFNVFHEGLANFRVNKLYGVIDTTGKIVVAPKFKSIGHFNGGVAWARDPIGLIGYINKSGEWLIEPIFSVAKDFDPISGLARVKSELGWGYVDMENNFITLDFTDILYDFSEGLAMFRQGDLLGYVDNKMNVAIPAKFKVANHFRNGYARVEYNNRWGIIDKKGNWVLQPVYKNVGNVVIIE